MVRTDKVRTWAWRAKASPKTAMPEGGSKYTQEAGGEDREKHSEQGAGQRQRERAVRSSAGLEARSSGELESRLVCAHGRKQS